MAENDKNWDRFYKPYKPKLVASSTALTESAIVSAPIATAFTAAGATGSAARFLPARLPRRPLDPCPPADDRHPAVFFAALVVADRPLSAAFLPGPVIARPPRRPVTWPFRHSPAHRHNPLPHKSQTCFFLPVKHL